MDSNLNDQIRAYQIHTYGCKVNTYDTGLIQKNLQRSGFEEIKNETSRIHVLNTCAVTAEASREAQRAIRRLKIKDPFCTVVVTGCAAQVDTGAFESMPGADLVVANSHKAQLPEILKKWFQGERSQKVFKSNIFRKDEFEPGGGVESRHTRSFLKIQDGCNSFCSYCIIPYARGKSRSLSRAELVQRILEIEKAGIREIVLTGVHIGDYEDGSARLEDLLEAVLDKTQIPRIRLTSLEPVEVTDRLLGLYQNPRLCPHFHMSIQSAQDQVLKDMKRQYGQREVVESFKRIRQSVPGAYIGMDVIVGFPTESLEFFDQTVEALTSSPWTRIHVFPYSERPGTRAAVLSESVPLEERARRAKVLRAISLERQIEEAKAQLGLKKSSLVLKSSAKGAQSLTRDYWPLRLQGADEFLEHWRGEEVEVTVTGHEVLTSDVALVGEVVP